MSWRQTAVDCLLCVGPKVIRKIIDCGYIIADYITEITVIIISSPLRNYIAAAA